MRIKTVFLLGAFFISCGAYAAESSPFGVCAHLNREELELVGEKLDISKDAGISWVRADFDWWQVEPEQGRFDFAFWDVIAESLKEKGMDMMVIFGGPPAYGSPLLEKIDLWYDYISNGLERYGNVITHWEIFNEPDLHFLEWSWNTGGVPVGKYAALLKDTYKFIKEKYPDIQVLCGSAGLNFYKGIFENGGADSFDIMNIHLYYQSVIPEDKMRKDIRDFKALMKEYGVEKKPMWLTECGNSTGGPDPMLEKILAAAFEKLGLDPEKETVLAIADDDYFYYTDGARMSLQKILPNAKNIKFISFADLESIDPNTDKILVLGVMESFPEQYFQFIADYVKNGGTLVLPGGVPFYYNLAVNEGGDVNNANWSFDPRSSLRINWTPFWSEKGAPEKVENIEVSEGFKNSIEPLKQNRFEYIDGACLAEGDKFVPIMEFEYNNKKRALAGIYEFNSDFKGNIICVLPQYGEEHTSEEWQAKLLPRLYIIGFSEGLDKIFYYRLRADEASYGKEPHFGIIHRDHSKKPAFHAYKTMQNALTDGVKNVKLIEKDRIFLASWDRSDGKKGYAIWTPNRNAEVNLKIKGKISQAFNLTGKKIKIQKNAPLKINGAITYIIGPSSISLSD